MPILQLLHHHPILFKRLMEIPNKIPQMLQIPHYQIHQIIQTIPMQLINHVNAQIHIWNATKDIEMMKRVVDAVLQVFECINQNTITKVNLYNNKNC